ncbi:unnamed protein product [Anisakis simplex]|uniref:Clusterin-associated protein 1 homolog (inferred by orthology to a C. elegans protein) n=1 Tax=Anisakis simplex TaxID=6269 RepID=A0A0M3JZZ8_ANISI|nr:unnamed protein product [Anisakis simplex]
MLRTLGYPRLISMENFRSPNFKLVAELLEWIVRRFDPNCRISTMLDTEQERVIFVKSAVLILLQKARIKLNPKKLYQADGYAVQELAVAIRLVHETTKQSLDSESSAIAWNALRSKINSKMQEVRACRQLASQIPQSGATLYDLLAKEVIAANELTQINHNIQNISSDEASLDTKIERKKREYDQQQKRLAKLQSFRPQYMDEYEKYEKKLKQLYAVYVLKFRNVAYLQQLQNEFDKVERQRTVQAEQAMRNIVERMRAEQIALTNNQLGELEAEEEAESRKKAIKVFGNMTGAGLSDEEADDDLGHEEFSEDDDEEEEKLIYDNKTSKTTREYTMPVIEALEKIIRPVHARRKNELERMNAIAQKYAPHFGSGPYFEALKATGNVCASVNKKEEEMLADVYDRVLAPMKSWVEEDYPRLMKDIKKCYALKDEMDRAVMAQGARQTPERSAKCEAAKKKHNDFFERVNTEYLYEKFSKTQFENAYTKCSAEIDAGAAALQAKSTSPGL